MACRSDYMEPTAREVELALVIKHLEHLGVPMLKTFDVDHLTAYLCRILGEELSPEEMDRLVYNGRDPAARALADWWDRHQSVDADRIAKETEDRKNAELRSSAMSKLTPEERKALKLDK